MVGKWRGIIERACIQSCEFCRRGAEGEGHSGELSRDAAGEYGEAGDGGSGGEYAGGSEFHLDAQSDQANAIAGRWLEESFW